MNSFVARCPSFNSHLLISQQTNAVAMSISCCMSLKAAQKQTFRAGGAELFVRFRYVHKRSFPKLVLSFCAAWVASLALTILQLSKSSSFRGSELSDVSIIRRLKGVEVLALRWVERSRKYLQSGVIDLHPLRRICKGINHQTTLTFPPLKCVSWRIDFHMLHPHAAVTITPIRDPSPCSQFYVERLRWKKRRSGSLQQMKKQFSWNFPKNSVFEIFSFLLFTLLAWEAWELS